MILIMNYKHVLLLSKYSQSISESKLKKTLRVFFFFIFAFLFFIFQIISNNPIYITLEFLSVYKL